MAESGADEAPAPQAEVPAPGTEQLGAGAPSSSPPRRRSAWMWVAGVAAAFVVAAFAVPVVMTATPRQCESCHEMQPYFDSWSTSSHREAASSCLDCHVRPGVLQWVAYEAGFYGEIAAHFQGATVSTTAANAPPVEACVRGGCHSVNRETSNAGDIKINHRLHVVQAKIPCTRCHPGAVHAGVGGRLKLPPMKLCKECHADKMQTCSYCHSSTALQGVPAGAH